MTLSVKGVTKRFRGVTAVDGIVFEVPERSIFGTIPIAGFPARAVRHAQPRRQARRRGLLHTVLLPDGDLRPRRDTHARQAAIAVGGGADGTARLTHRSP